ncbi:MAG: DUF3175 domain-containing protein [Alphaproteobacteria bacterium]|nr:DUF3175 domain-containing protein [Alphaproteobacteria bacterium]
MATIRKKVAAKRRAVGKLVSARKRATARRGTRWSQVVTKTSNALDLRHGVFALRSARAVAMSLKRSADRSVRRKAGAFRSAMSMLNFYLNRGGRNITAARKRVLDKAKHELRKLYGKAAVARRSAKA